MEPFDENICLRNLFEIVKGKMVWETDLKMVSLQSTCFFSVLFSVWFRFQDLGPGF